MSARPVVLRAQRQGRAVVPGLPCGGGGILPQQGFPDHASRRYPSQPRRGAPWLPVNALNAFIEAKEVCYRNLAKVGHLFTTLPWPVDEYEAAKALMGEDYWPYGVEANSAEIEAMTRYSYEQGLTARKLSAEDLFAASTFKLAKSECPWRRPPNRLIARTAKGTRGPDHGDARRVSRRTDDGGRHRKDVG